MTLVSLYYDESGSLFNGEELNWDVFIVVRIVIDYNYFSSVLDTNLLFFKKSDEFLPKMRDFARKMQ
jgi:hypothetical protein